MAITPCQRALFQSLFDGLFTNFDSECEQYISIKMIDNFQYLLGFQGFIRFEINLLEHHHMEYRCYDSFTFSVYVISFES